MLDEAKQSAEQPEEARPGEDYVRAKREEKRAAAEKIGIDSNYISSFVDRFYARIREDELLGPIFAERIADWDVHLGKMKRFWRSILHNSGEFKGNPMIKPATVKMTLTIKARMSCPRKKSRQIP